jgi:hypothetical protein
MNMIVKGLRGFSANGRFYSSYLVEIGLAEIYFQIATRTRPLTLWSAIKNMGFILTEVPFARRKAKAFLNRIIQVGREVGASGYVHGHALLNLGLLHQQSGSHKQAKECLVEAQRIFSQCNSETGSQQVRQALSALG